jgi:hypothetical protein
MGQKFRSFALRSSKEILCPNGDNTATASAMTAQSNGGRKGQESKIERNQKLRLKVGDEIAPSDNRNETIQFINSKDGDETQRLNAQFNLAATQGVGLKPSDSSKGFVIAMVRSDASEGPPSLLSMDSTETLKSFARNGGSLPSPGYLSI